MRLLVNYPVLLLLIAAGAILSSAAPSYARSPTTLESSCATLFNDNLEQTRTPSQSCTSRASSRSETEAQISRVINRAICDGKIKDAVVLIGNSKGVIYEKGFNTNSKIDVSYDLASLTKPIATATAVLKLVEESKGKIRLDDPISKHVPVLKGKGLDKVTIGDLLRHRAKIAEIDATSANAWKGLSKDAALDKAALIIARETREHKPQLESFKYRDSAYVLLAELIQEKTGNYEGYVQNKILKPLGMTQSRFKTTPGDKLARSLKGSAGNAGLFSTAQDVARFAQIFLTDKNPVLTPASVHLMTEATSEDKSRFLNLLERLKIKSPTKFLMPGERPELHSAGFDLDPISLKGSFGEFSDKAFGHTGSSGTSLLIDPEKDIYVVVLTRNSMPTYTESQQKASSAAMSKIRSQVAQAGLELVNPKTAQPMFSFCHFSSDRKVGQIRHFLDPEDTSPGAENSSAVSGISSRAEQ